MKRIILSLFALLLLGSSAKGAEGFSVKNVSLPINGQAELQVAYNFDTRTCRGIEFNIYLPSELDFVVKSSKIDYAQGFYNSEGTYTVSKVQDGSLKVLWAGTGNIPIHRKEGIIIAVKVKVKEGATINVNDELQGSLKNGVIGANEVSDCPFTVTVTEANPTNYVVVDENSLFAPSTGTKNVLVKRTLKKGVWNTICLPFSMNNDQLKDAFGDDVQVAQFSEWSYDDTEESIIINFESVGNGITNGYPYLIKVSSDIQQFYIEGVKISTKITAQSFEDSEGMGYYGFMTGNLKYTTMNENDLFIQNNKFYYSIQGQTIKGLRAIFNFYDGETPEDSNPIIISQASASRGMFLVDGKPIDGIDDGTTKISYNRFISETGKVYSVTGRYMGENVDMKTLPKGVYIVDGVKIIND
jgi:hypothetical protein